MTTIAYRAGILAADTGVCVGGSRAGYTVKIVRRPDGALAAAAGFAAYCYAFRNWFLSGGDPPEAKTDTGVMDRGTVFYADGRIEIFEPGGRFFMTAPYYAMGSGRPEALGAMHYGAGAINAVKAAIAHDNDTFGEISALSHDGLVAVNISEALGLEPMREAAE